MYIIKILEQFKFLYKRQMIKEFKINIIINIGRKIILVVEIFFFWTKVNFNVTLMFSNKLQKYNWLRNSFQPKTWESTIYKVEDHLIWLNKVNESNQDKKSKNLDDFFLPQNRLKSLIWVIERFPKNILFFFLVSNFCFRAF